MAVALVLVAIALGSVLFHVYSPWWWTPIASNWGYIDTTLIITFWITGVVFVAVVLFMAYCVYRFRHGTREQPHYEPENKDRKSTRLNSSHANISYAVFCLKKKI